MVYRRRDRGDTYYTRPKLPLPFGRIGPYGLTKDRKTAEAMDAMLHQLALDRPEAIEALLAGKFTVADLFVAYRRSQAGQDRIRELVETANDPPLRQAIEEYLPHCTDKRTAKGFKDLVRLAPTKARLSWLAGKNLSAMYAKELARGVKPNSVHRGLHRAVAELLLHNYGKLARAKKLEGVLIPTENDRREVQVEPEQIEKLIAALDEEAAQHVLALILTAVDVKPLSRMLVRHFDEDAGTVIVPDRKTRSRLRKLELSTSAEAVFRRAASGKGPDENLFPLRYGQLSARFRSARTAAGLDRIPINLERTEFSALRIKDLRHLLPTALNGMGVDWEHIRQYVGHAAGSKDTSRYITPRGSKEKLDQATERLGLGTHLKVG